MNSYSAVFLVSLSVAACGAWFMFRFACRFGLIDVPNDRSSHSLPTPRGGGLGILVSFIVSSVALRIPLLFWLPAFVLSLVSFFDDRLGLSPKTRLFFQFAASTVVVISICSSLPATLLVKVLLIIILPVFIVGTANFYNFMDGIHGIAAMTGLTGFALLAYFASLKGLYVESLHLLGISAACLGFLPFNFPSARVFMGDVGSILLGFVFAASVIALSTSLIEFLALSGCLFPFYADSLSTLFVRWRNGERLFQAHRRHLYQIMANQLRIPHWKISTGYFLLQSLTGFICIRLANSSGFLILFLGGLFIVWCSLMYWARANWEHS